MSNVKKVLPPLKVVKPFSMRLGPQKKGAMYGFGKLSGLVARRTSTSPGIGTVFGRVPNFGRLSSIYSKLGRPSKLGIGSPISVSSIPGPRLGKVRILSK